MGTGLAGGEEFRGQVKVAGSTGLSPTVAVQEEDAGFPGEMQPFRARV